jgi:hypothetical protein
VPQGAVIYLDGKPMTLADGTNAKTPSDLHSLQYGTEYAIKLVKPGYRPFETKVVMGEQTDNQTIRPDLTAFPGWLIAEVQGEGKDEVQILFNNEEVGQGPMVKKEVEGNTDVVVKGKLAGKVCTANPPRVRVEPNVTLTTTLKCTTAVAVPRPAAAPPHHHQPRRRAPPTPSPGCAPRRANPVVGSGDCVTDPSLPPGYVTISTKPYATLFWNGRKLGETPVSKVRLPSGCVTLNAKTKSGADHTFQVKVEPNKVNIYKHNLE